VSAFDVHQSAKRQAATEFFTASRHFAAATSMRPSNPRFTVTLVTEVLVRATCGFMSLML
jgi:hypothetical protein